MADIHRILGLASLGLSVVVLATTAAAALLGERLPPQARAWSVDGLALLVEGAIVLTAIVGPAVLASGKAPADALHYLYSAIAVLALPVALGIAMARGTSGRGRDRWLALGSLVLVGVSVRLLQTG